MWEEKQRGAEAVGPEGHLTAGAAMATVGHNDRQAERTQHDDCFSHSNIKHTALHFVFVPMRSNLFIHLHRRSEWR